MGDEDKAKDRLLEIYKLHTNIANEISNRRASVNRQYILILSGLVFGAGAILRVEKITQGFVLECIITLVGVLGMVLSGIWQMSIEYHLNANTVRYDALKDLENKLDHKFFQDEWERLSHWDRNKNYRELARIELYAPIVFSIAFTAVLTFGITSLLANKPNNTMTECIIASIVISGLILFYIRFWISWYSDDTAIPKKD